MENLINLILWFAISAIASLIFVSNLWRPVKRNELDIKFAYEIALHKAEQREILKHKWLESEKAGRDIGMELAQKTWEECHAEDWRQSKKKAA
jgi:hypothetical protein